MTKAGKLGCIADDFTGAGDAASFLVKGGARTVLFCGVPDEGMAELGEYDALVVALKSRTQPLPQALGETEMALRFLMTQGVEQIYFKYCSTFDSTPRGNIGPVADALMEWLDVPYTLLCPALPVNGRTVRDGCLYVNGVPLQESHMKDHPLTPMWDCCLERLMAPQSKYPCLKLGRAALAQPEGELQSVIRVFGSGKPHFYLIPDMESCVDAERIVERFGGLRLLTGGSGLMTDLAKARRNGGEGGGNGVGAVSGRALVLAGSCSEATLSQVAYYQKMGGAAVKIDPMALLRGTSTVESLWRQAESQPGPVLLYSSGKPWEVRAAQAAGGAQVSVLLEETMAGLALRAVRAGVQRIIVAGGETSGAVTEQLGFRAYAIGESVAPGVPIMAPLGEKDLRIVLKSGNFGAEDFFFRALDKTGM